MDPEQQPRYVPPSSLQATNPDDAQVLHMAQTLYGEFAGVKDKQLQKEYMIMAASAAHNTYGKGEWAKDDWDTHLYKRFDAVRLQNQPYKQALSGKFTGKDEEMAWKRSMQIAYGVKSGTIEKAPGQFYFTKDEYKKIAGTPALPNPDQLQKVRSLGQYDVYAYKEKKGNAVELQQKLKDSGYYEGEVDGKIGPVTKKAIMKFQQDNDLKVDGIAGKQTLAKLAK